MKLFYVHITDISKNDTSETFVVNNALSIAEQGIETHLFVVNRSLKDGNAVLSEKFDLKELPETFHLHDIFLKGKSHWSFYRKVVKFLQDDAHKDAVIVTRKHSILPHLIAGKQSTQKIFFETHDFFYDLSVRKDLKKSKRRKHSLLERLFFKRMDGLICLNKYQKDLYLDRINIPIKVFPTGFKKIEYKSQQREKKLLYIGSFEERKGIENILNLAKILDSSFKIIIIGSRKISETKDLQLELDQRNISEKVEIKQWLSKRELNEILKSAKLGLLPLKSGFFNEYLTVPLKYFDYAAFGLPVIASDFPSLREYIEDGVNGCLVNWSDVESVKKRVTELACNDEKWCRYSDNQLIKSAEMTWDQRAIDQVQYFKEFLS